YRRKETRERYVLGDEIGRGNFATVFQATDSVSGNLVAVKVMNKEVAPREICENELSILEEISGKVAHQRITPIMDVYEDKENLYFVLELMRGGDFFDYVAAHGRLSEQEAAVVIRKLCYALGALHRHGILHRDVKLENLLLHEQSEEEKLDMGGNAFKLGDFGFASKIDQSDSFKNPAGTMGYVAPEILDERSYSPACDVWSAGVVMYILLAGHPPFPHKPGVDVASLSVQEQLEMELEAIHFGAAKPRWNKHLEKGAWKHVSHNAKHLVTRMLRVDPARRYTTEQVLTHPWIVGNTRRRQTEFLGFE
ncbi:Calcium/calmodulin-dependent protein kinase type 1 (CaM kinase I) (CaM-KI), partial [Durusdinium trenchii]